MIFKEFALDPGLITSIDKCVKFMNLFGLENGKQLSNYPRRWRRRVLAAIKDSDLDDMEKKEIEISLSTISQDIFVDRNSSKFDETIDWIENAIKEDKRKSFYGIITREENDHKNIFSEKDVNTNNEKLQTPQSVNLNNSASEMVKWMKPLIQDSSIILFIDNYFKPYSNTFIKPLKLYSEMINRSPNRSTYVELQFHCGMDVVPRKWSDKPEKWLINDVNKHIRSVLPKNSISKFFLWNSGDYHDRFILTQEFGGVNFGHSWGTISDQDKKMQNVNYIEKNGSMFKDNWNFFYNCNIDPVLTISV